MSAGDEAHTTDEVELTADELLSIARDKSASPSSTPVSANVEARKQHSSPSPAVITGFIGAGVVLFAAAGMALYVMQRSAPIEIQRTQRWTPLPSPEPAPAEEFAAPIVTGKPVRIRNAFDKNEVFEFPPGTSPQAAREAVAEILLRRAMERQSGVR